jgi:Tfp pilus assembly protein PilN
MIADVVNDLLKLTPKDVVFSAIQLDRSGALAVRGSALTGKDVNAFQSNLVNSDRFKDVSLEYATKRRRVNAEVTEFRLVCRIHIPEGASP